MTNGILKNPIAVDKRRKVLSSVFQSVLRAIFLIAFAYILLYPVIYMLSTALKTSQDFIDPTVNWVPKHYDFSSFTNAFKAMDYPTAFLNTMQFEIVSCLIEVFTCSVFAYGLARFDFPFKKLLYFVMILTILVPDVMLLMPRVMYFKKLDFLGVLGLINQLTGIDIRPDIIDTSLAFYLPSVFGIGLKGGLFMFIYIQFFKGLPKELEEAAWIDGAGMVRTFLSVILPSSGVVFLTVFIFSVVWHWNDYYLALMYTSENRTLAYVVQNLRQYVFTTFGELSSLDARRYTLPMAGCIMFIIPPTVLYVILQRKFIQSVDRVGIVG